MQRVLTTDDFVTGVRCARQLWYRINRPEDEGSALHRAYREDQYRRLAAVAGLSSEPEVREYDLTPQWRVSARVEELGESESGWSLVFLRPATSVKDSFVWEAAFADHVFARTGAGGGEVVLRYLRKTYRRIAGDDYRGLLIDADVTRRARGRAAEVPSRLERMMEILALPEADMLEQVEPCRRRTCPACTVGRSKVERLAALPPGSELSPVQQIHLAARASGKRHIDLPAIAAFLEELEYPLSFLDFEAYSEAVPSAAGLAPWEHVPVIYSLHRQERPGAPPAHHVYAALPGEDGRCGLYRDLVSRIGERGSIVVYGKGFERRMLERLAVGEGTGAGAGAGNETAHLAAARTAADPLPPPKLENIIPRLVDISRIFARGEYYDPRQEGSASLKAVYHAMIGGEYGELEVADGRDANVLYYFLRHGFPDGQELDGEVVLEDLKRYCSLDTEALFHIVEYLWSLV
ncbi:MAG: DUF2779 domain-containing protein [Spirochaetes bacterium]|nr:DUF2779 domain-containing protein [Spirochaetota bacterium]